MASPWFDTIVAATAILANLAAVVALVLTVVDRRKSASSKKPSMTGLQKTLVQWGFHV
jgi:hypothetical protein